MEEVSRRVLSWFCSFCKWQSVVLLTSSTEPSQWRRLVLSLAHGSHMAVTVTWQWHCKIIRTMGLISKYQDQRFAPVAFYCSFWVYGCKLCVSLNRFNNNEERTSNSDILVRASLMFPDHCSGLWILRFVVRSEEDSSFCDCFVSVSVELYRIEHLSLWGCLV